MVVNYLAVKDLKRFERSLDYSPGSFRLTRLFKSRADDPMGTVKNKIDAIYERVQTILDMRRKLKKKVTINLYSNGDQLDKIYKQFTGRKRRTRAWYIYEPNVIYMNARDVHEGMLAHELAHSIIDRYLRARPPRATAEILARYVDAHLHD